MTIRRVLSLAVALAVTASLAVTQADPALAAKKKKEPPQGAADAGAPEKPFKEWSKTLKDAETIPGYLTLHKKRESLYLELKPDQLGVPVLGIFSLARGIGSNFVLGGLPVGDHLLEFQRSEDHVLVLEKNVRFITEGDKAFDLARELSYGHSVLASLKIESINDSSKAVLVDLAPFLVSDVSDMADGLQGALDKSMRFDKERSSLGLIKNFPENTEVEATLTYSPNDRKNFGLPTVSDNRYVPLTIHYSFSKLPATPMMPRLADDRTGFFLTAKKDFTRDTEDDYWRRFVERWRLEKKDPAAAMSEPVKPIVFYVDRTVPEKYRASIKKGIEGWNKAFEAAGFKNAIQAKDPPDDPDWHAEDVRYSTIRWIVSSQPSFGAIGPSRVDPRSGEILDADILFEGSIVQRRLQLFRRIGADAVARGILPEPGEWPKFLDPRLRCDAPIGIAEGAALAHIGMLTNGAIPPGGPLPEQFIDEMLVHVTLHEVGHSLGLTHNFRSSTATPKDKLHDRAWTSAHGLTASVMDYAAPNIAPTLGAQGDFYGVTAGDYDLWMIRYGYTPSGATNVDEDYKFAKKIADESTQPGHIYANDADTYPADALDPRTNIWDLGDDPLAFGQDRAAWIAGLWQNPAFEERMLGADGSYPTLRGAMDDLLSQYAISLGMGVKWVGGQYHSRAHRGQVGAPTVPLEPVSAARQREAMDFIAKKGFAPDAFKVSPDLLNRLAPERWNHWGMQNAWGQGGARLDYNLNDKVLAIQTRLVEVLTAPKMLARLSEAESRSADSYRMSEHFDRMTRALWGEVGGEATTGLTALERPGTRRELQRDYVDRLGTLMLSPPPGTPDDARALARLQLTRVDSRARRALEGGATLGDYTRAHLMETRARIDQALHAQREVSDRPAGGGPGGPTVPAN